MASVIIMPKQGLLMEEGTITKWLAKEGEQTTEGAPLFEMETDKLTITMDSTATGTVLKILHPEGDTVPITQPIAIVGQPGEDISALLGGEAPAAAPAAAAPEAPTAEAAPAPQPVVEHAPGERVFSSPRARLRAEENGVDIAAVPGSGPDGLVVERDVQNYIANQPTVTPLAANQARIQGIDLSGLTGIAAKSAELIEKAREGRLTEADYHGGTFTVSSLGMFDLDDFVAIINPPESAILAVGKIAKTPVVVTDDEGEDQVVIKSMCALCLSYDHRIIDGAEAAKFLQKLKSYLQNPILLI